MGMRREEKRGHGHEEGREERSGTGLVTRYCHAEIGWQSFGQVGNRIGKINLN